ncbi:MAG: hypothetical protein KAI77_06325 [Gammaproteobacteria bacterium]|nr:hypothetical protein [Gammaproteobacteria bacterium]
MAKDYINHPDDDSAGKILKIFKVDCWPAPLTDTDTNFMNELLVTSGEPSDDNISEPDK